MQAVPLVVAQPRAQAPVDAPAFHRWTYPDGSTCAHFHRSGTGYLVRFHGLADFEIPASGEHVLALPTPDVALDAVRNLHLNQVTPLALSLQGEFVVHASAVLVDGGCVAFAGPSGRGKSTLAASFAVAGHPFLTEDGLRIDAKGEAPVGWPSHPSIRLWDDSRDALLPEAGGSEAGKLRLPAGGALAFHHEPAPLRAIFHLGRGEAAVPLIEPLQTGAAFVELVRVSYILDIGAADLLASHFEAATHVCRLPIHYHLDYPRRFDALPEVRAAVVRHLESLRTP